jgi:hypothetical protein
MSGFTQAGEPLGQQRHLLVCAGPEDLPQDVQRALFLILPEVRVRNGNALSNRRINVSFQLQKQ